MKDLYKKKKNHKMVRSSLGARRLSKRRNRFGDIKLTSIPRRSLYIERQVANGKILATYI